MLYFINLVLRRLNFSFGSWEWVVAAQLQLFLKPGVGFLETSQD